jgi:hypothetical protein
MMSRLSGKWLAKGLAAKLPARRLAILGAVTGLLAAVAGAAAPAASADTVVNAHYALTGSAYIKGINSTLNLPPGSLTASDDLTTGAVSSSLSLPPITVSMTELGFIPVTATATMAQDGPATGGFNLSTNSISATASVIFKISKITVGGINVPVGSDCASSPFSVSLTSGADFTINGGGPLAGSFTLPDMHHCGALTPFLNLVIPGPGNTFNLTLGALQVG